jgi:rare lipoprotein A
MSLMRLLVPTFAIIALAPAIASAQSVGASAQRIGVASWYGGKHDGKRTSSGEVFDQEGLTAASRSIPLGSRVRVTMTDTGESVVVTVNDRMGGRSSIIDLSKGAARQIGLLGRGRSEVSIASADNEPLEVAEATDDDLADAPAAIPHTRATNRGRRHSRPMGRASAIAHRDTHRPTVVLARQTVQHHAIKRKL